MGKFGKAYKIEVADKIITENLLDKFSSIRINPSFESLSIWNKFNMALSKKWMYGMDRISWSMLKDLPAKCQKSNFIKL